MRRRVFAIPDVVREIDYIALRETIEHVFMEEYGVERVHHVHVAHFNPYIIDVTVTVQDRTPDMDELALELSDAFRQQDLRVAIDITEIGTEL